MQSGTDAATPWALLARHLDANYHQPDLEAIRVVTSATLAHFLWPESSPVWLMVVGASGTGKTEIMMSVVEGFPKFYALSNLTENTLLSGWRGTEAGLLARLAKEQGRDIVLGISDFSSVTGLRADKLKVVAAQMREMYDGKVSKDFGVGKHEQWEGKITMIVGCTRSVERLWGLQKELGERFCLLRWRAGDGEELAKAAMALDKRDGIRQRTTELAMQWWDSIDQKLAEQMIMLQGEKWKFHIVATLVARLRCPVIRGESGVMLDVGDQEGPGRLVRTMWQLARAHAVLSGRSDVIKEDVQLALRVARESVPTLRWRIMEKMSASKVSLGLAELQKEFEKEREGMLPAATMRSHLEELEAIGALDSEETAGQKWWAIHPWVKERWETLYA